MEEIDCCFKCGNKKFIKVIKYEMENCSHIYCVNCIYQDLFLKSLPKINYDTKSFTVQCHCEHGSIVIPINSLEDLFSKKYTIDSDETKEIKNCQIHKNIEKTLFCKTCKIYLCPKCSTLNDKFINNASKTMETPQPNENNPKQITDLNEHEYHDVVVAEELCNKYKEFLKDIKMKNKTVNDFVNKFNTEITNYEREFEREIDSTLKQIDDIINKLYKIKNDCSNLIEKKYNDWNKLLKIIKLFYANFYLDYENYLNFSDVYTLQYLKNINQEFTKLECKKETNKDSLEKILENIKSEVNRINIKQEDYINYNFKFEDISRQFNPIQRLIGHRQVINTIIQLNDGRLLTGSDDFKMKFWEEQGEKFINTLTIDKLTGDILCVYELKDLRIIITNKSSGAMKVWQKQKDSEMYDLTITLSEHQQAVTSIIQLSDEKLITGSKDNTIKLWDISENSLKCTQTLSKHKLGVCALCELTGRRFASASDDTTIGIWEEENNKFKCVKVLTDHKTKVKALVQTNNGILITGGEKIIIIYEIKDNNFTKIQKIDNVHTSYITKFIKLSDGKVASSSRDKTIVIWNFGKNNKLTVSETLKGHTHSVYDIVELKDGRLASVGSDNIIIIWKSGKIID